MQKIKLILILLLSLNVGFSLNEETIGLTELSPGMSGEMLTVIKGTEPSKIPVKLIAVTSQGSDKDLILVKIQNSVKLAQGMSGSPVYFSGKLAGAVRSGYENSDQRLMLVTPIRDMLRLTEYEENSRKLANVTVSGISASLPSMRELSGKLGVKFSQGVSSSHVRFSSSPEKFKPGSAITVMLVWGDVEMSALGTVTTVNSHGEFLAIGHEFLKRGKVNYPSAGAIIHDIVNSVEFPFKLSNATEMNGTITQDRDSGLLGKMGKFAPSISCKFIFRDLDLNTEKVSNFRTVADEELAGTLIEGVCQGLTEELWDRKGGGTMSVTLKLEGKGIEKGWTRRDIFYSDEDVTKEAFKQSKEILESFFTQPFSEVLPAGVTLTVEGSSRAKVLSIEDVKTVNEAEAGEEVEVEVRLREWRGKIYREKFRLKIPEEASGVVELIVRGGGTQSFEQAGIKGGWKTITSLERMLKEFRSADGNNQLILELNADTLGEELREVMNGKEGKDFLPEEEEFLSETKERRKKEKTLEIYDSENVVNGLMRRIIHVK